MQKKWRRDLLVITGGTVCASVICNLPTACPINSTQHLATHPPTHPVSCCVMLCHAVLARQVPSMTYEGTLWFTNLTIPDPFMGLPIICALTTLAQVHSKRFSDAMLQAGPNAANMKPLMTVMAFMVAVIGWWQPSAMALLWASNSVLAIGQNALLGSPKMREMLKLPPLVQQQAAAAAAGSSSSSSSGSSSGQSWWTWWQQLFTRGQEAPPPRSSSSTAAAPRAPPPGVAVNYIATKPRRRVKI